jgi:hypothetical protein
MVFVALSALMILVLAVSYISVAVVPTLRPVINDLTAVVVDLLLATPYYLGQANIPDCTP